MSQLDKLDVRIKSKRLAENTSWALGQFRQFQSILRKQFEFPEECGLSVAVDDRPIVNASAYWNSDHGSYVISFSLGLCVWAHHLAVDACIAHSRNFAEPQTPRSLGTAQNNVISTEDELNQLATELDKQLPPDQVGFAQFVFGAVLKSVFFHEVSHILRGHVDVMRARKRSATGLIDELEIRRSRPNDPIRELIRPMEYEADRFGATLAADTLLNFPEAFERWKPNTLEENCCYSIWSFALFCVALEEDDGIAGKRSSTYPSPLVRLSNHVGALQGYLDRSRSEEFDFVAIADQAFSMMAVFEDWYPGIAALRRFMDNATQEAIQVEAMSIIDELEKHEALLAEFRFNERRTADQP